MISQVAQPASGSPQRSMQWHKRLTPSKLSGSPAVTFHRCGSPSPTCGDPPTFLVFRRAGAIVAALSYCRLISAVTVTRLVVHPAYLRQGIATALLIELEQRISATIVYVSTAAANLPAVQL